MQATKTITLARGYRDAEGNDHKDVMIRAPRVDDEIKADAEIARMKVDTAQARLEAQSETLQILTLIQVCTIQFGKIVKPPIEMYRSLSRADAKTLINAFFELEYQDFKDGHEDGDEDGAELDPNG